MSYDPGTPKAAEHIRAGLFNVQSFREAGKVYRVDVHAGSCTCEHHRIRGAYCKHQKFAADEMFKMAWNKALKVETSDLLKHAERTDLPAVTIKAIRSVLRFRATCETIRTLEIAA